MTLMLVEDEPPILRNLVQLIQEFDPAFVVVSQEPDGALALDVLRSGTVVDVLITDIRMPMMDGLQLSETVRREFPGIDIVVLTGHQEFSYVHSALRLGVVDYLLKPVVPDELRALLTKLALRREENRRQSLYAAIDLAWKGRADAVSTGSGRFAVILAGAGTLVETSLERFSPGLSFWDKADMEGLLRLLMHSGEFCVREGSSAAEKIILVQQDNLTGESIERLAQGLFQALATPGLPLCVAYYVAPVAVADVRLVYDALKWNLGHRTVIGQASLLPVSSPKNHASPTSIPYDSGKEALLARAAEAGSRELLAEGFRGLFQVWKEASLPPILVERYLKTLITNLQGAVEMAPDTFLDVDEEIRFILAGATAFTDLVEPMADLVLSLGSGARHVSGTDELVQRTKEYLEMHFTESISGDALSRRIGIVPSYLSRLFKKSTGLSPPEYVIRLRMDRAAELLTNPQMMVKHVARAVGYEDPNHFSRVFHKTKGCWPREFQLHRTSEQSP